MFTDTHAHLSFPDFASDRPATIARATAAGVTRIVSVATDLADAHRVLAVAGQYPGVFAAVGDTIRLGVIGCGGRGTEASRNALRAMLRAVPG